VWPDFPIREIRDPQVLRALSHPVRLRLLDELLLSGSATATELSDLVGESPANCSWHLRQLARYGFVEEAGGGTGRQRPWRIVAEGNRWGSDDQADTELARAGDTAGEMFLAQEVEALRSWWRNRRREPAQWRDTSFFTQVVSWLTVEELGAVRETVVEALKPYLDRIGDAGKRPAGSRPIRLIAWGVPARPLPDGASSPPDPSSSPDPSSPH
jgi:DNA-binding transcriptional ArsR family regulator